MLKDLYEQESRTCLGALYENTAYICVKDKRENNGRQDVCGVNKGGTAEMLGPLWGRASRRFYIGAYRK